MKTKDVALVLSSGGPRGWAYIGAIEELESRGYNITSIAGTSIGSLIGGIYAAGRLADIKDWLFSLDAWKVFSLMDISLSKNHLVKGDKVIGAIKEIVPEINIEDLPPAVAKSSQENSIAIPFGITLDEAEKIIIQQNLASNKNNKSKTADILGIGRKTLQRKLLEWGEDEEKSDGDNV